MKPLRLPTVPTQIHGPDPSPPPPSSPSNPLLRAQPGVPTNPAEPGRTRPNPAEASPAEPTAAGLNKAASTGPTPTLPSPSPPSPTRSNPPRDQKRNGDDGRKTPSSPPLSRTQRYPTQGRRTSRTPKRGTGRTEKSAPNGERTQPASRTPPGTGGTRGPGARDRIHRIPGTESGTRHRYRAVRALKAPARPTSGAVSRETTRPCDPPSPNHRPGETRWDPRPPEKDQPV